MVERVVDLEVGAVDAVGLDEVERQRLVGDVDRAHEGVDPAGQLVADRQLDERAGQARLQVAAVVDEMAARERVGEHRHAGLRGRLLVHDLGVAAARRG